MESFPSAGRAKTPTSEAPVVEISNAIVNSDDFVEQMSAKAAGKAIIEATEAQTNFSDEGFEDLESTIDTLDLSNEQRAAKAEKDRQNRENIMQDEADDLTSDILRLQITEGVPEAQAINKAIIDMCTKLQAEGISPDNAGGRAMHAFARHLESTAGYKKDDPANKAKLARMQDVINKIMGTNVLGLGQEKVIRGGELTDIAQVVGSEKVTGNQDIRFTGTEIGQTDQAPAMFRLDDLMEKPQPKKRPSSGASTN